MYVYLKCACANQQNAGYSLLPCSCINGTQTHSQHWIDLCIGKYFPVTNTHAEYSKPPSNQTLSILFVLHMKGDIDSP